MAKEKEVKFEQKLKDLETIIKEGRADGQTC